MACFAGPSYQDVQIERVVFLPVTLSIAGQSLQVLS